MQVVWWMLFCIGFGTAAFGAYVSDDRFGNPDPEELELYRAYLERRFGNLADELSVKEGSQGLLELRDGRKLSVSLG